VTDVALILANMNASYSVAHRLAWSQERVANLFPVEVDSVANFDDETEEKLDAWLHRFNSLASMIQDSLFKSAGLLEQEDVAAMSNRDKTLLMERIGVVQSATGFSNLTTLRNKLAHNYPDDPEKQSERLNAVWHAVADLLQVMNAILTFMERKHRILLGLPPIVLGFNGGGGPGPR
jgi:uncharacterized protein YutE (UPF0331/DUF86 family)